LKKNLKGKLLNLRLRVEKKETLWGKLTGQPPPKTYPAVGIKRFLPFKSSANFTPGGWNRIQPPFAVISKGKFPKGEI